MKIQDIAEVKLVKNNTEEEESNIAIIIQGNMCGNIYNSLKDLPEKQRQNSVLIIPKNGNTLLFERVKKVESKIKSLPQGVTIQRIKIEELMNIEL